MDSCKFCGKPLCKETWTPPANYIRPDLAGKAIDYYVCTICGYRYSVEEVEGEA